MDTNEETSNDTPPGHVLTVAQRPDGLYWPMIDADIWLGAIAEFQFDRSERLREFLVAARIAHPSAEVIAAWMHAYESGIADGSAEKEPTQGSGRPLRIGGLDASGPLFLATGGGDGSLLTLNLGGVIVDVSTTGETYLIVFTDGRGVPDDWPPRVYRITAEEPSAVLRFAHATGHCRNGHTWHCRPDHVYDELNLHADGDTGTGYPLMRLIQEPYGDSSASVACPSCSEPLRLTADTD